MGKLDDKIALITGSSSGIGKAVALAFAREGAHIALNYPNDSEAQNAAEVSSAIAALGRRVTATQADVSKEDQARALVDETMRTYGRIDILVNNAGIATVSTVGEMPVAMWDEMMAVNLRSVFLCTRLVLPIMYQQNGFDHGVGHSLLLLYDEIAPNCQKSKEFKSLGHYPSNTVLSAF